MKFIKKDFKSLAFYRINAALAILFLACSSALSQVGPKHDYVWTLGYGNSSDSTFGGTNIDFNFSPPDAYYVYRDMDIHQANGSICDQEGNLLFYTNGCFIADRNNQLMPNGDSLNAGFFYDAKCDHTGYPGTQNILILPQPGQIGRYFVFHQRQNFTPDVELITDRLLYTIVDMNLNNGLGAVVEKNVPAISEVLYYGHLTAVKHANGVDWWIICAKRKSNVYFSLLLTAEGVEGPFEQTIGKVTTKEGEGSGRSNFRLAEQDPVGRIIDEATVYAESIVAGDTQRDETNRQFDEGEDFGIDTIEATTENARNTRHLAVITEVSVRFTTGLAQIDDRGDLEPDQ